MILLKNIRLINWYGFENVTAPIGFFTLIAGKNGNGKSVLLDAIKYAAYGDTVFNKSSDSKGTRTLVSYTRGLLDATAKTFMRPAEKQPNVVTHIVLEFYDYVEAKNFVLGTVLETNASNNVQSFRYIVDKKNLQNIEHLHEEHGVKKPLTSTAFQKKYGVKLMNKEQGIAKFMQMTGLKLESEQVHSYLRKLRGIMSYDPNAKIDQFIRESVLEEKKIDFSNLIDTRESVRKTKTALGLIQSEITEIGDILADYQSYENECKRLLIDDIKIAYKQKLELSAEKEKEEQKESQAKSDQIRILKQKEELEGNIKLYQKNLQTIESSLNDLDCVKPIKELEEHLTRIKESQRKLKQEKEELNLFQEQINVIRPMLKQEDIDLKEQNILFSLCAQTYSVSDKELSVMKLKEDVDEGSRKASIKIEKLKDENKEIDEKIEFQKQIISDCNKNHNSFQNIPDYVALKEEINKEFRSRKIMKTARFACEYVLELKDEAWRDAIETFLGPRRYTILIDPEYYDIADEVVNRSKYKYAHIFNTKLLMKKQIEANKDSIVHLLTIKNEIAQKYFDYLLGRIKAVGLNDVKNYENAMSKEGKVSINMDSYFLRFKNLRTYYLGQETLELNLIRAEKDLQILQTKRSACLERLHHEERIRLSLLIFRDLFKTYNYDAFQQYKRNLTLIQEDENKIDELITAQRDNQEFFTLMEFKEKYEQLLKKANEDKFGVDNKYLEICTTIQRCADHLKQIEKDINVACDKFVEYEHEEYTSVQKAVAAYDKFIENNYKGPGGLLILESRRRTKDGIEKYKKDILIKQGEYNGKRSEENRLATGIEYRSIYESRRNKIWMDDLQSVKKELNENTMEYEKTFKNEFVLKVLNNCKNARDELKKINYELNKLKFDTNYQFDVHLVKDQSDYAKILTYAKYLDDKKPNGSVNGQISFDELEKYSNDEIVQLEKDIKEIINKIIEKNNNDLIEKYADYRNYMIYEILITNETFDKAKLSKQTGYNSGAEIQIPYLLILSSALLMIYNERVNSTRLVFIDEPFVKMDPSNVKLMLAFLKEQRFQVIFCAPDKTEVIGNECEVILPVLKVKPDNMQMGMIKFHEDKRYE